MLHYECHICTGHFENTTEQRNHTNMELSRKVSFIRHHQVLSTTSIVFLSLTLRLLLERFVGLFVCYSLSADTQKRQEVKAYQKLSTQRNLQIHVQLPKRTRKFRNELDGCDFLLIFLTIITTRTN